jgi:mRNA-degrading endonuclease RelE of RelBE toxin-antitoxin system
MEFFEAPAFTRHLNEYLTEEQYSALQQELSNIPDLGQVMPGTGGFRKLRLSDERRGRGKRGGLRLIYYWFERDQQIWMTTVYSKGEADDLTPAQKKALKKAIAAETKARELLRKQRAKWSRR